ncbi:hypothetical protein B0O80DRAFT_100540 [Mortierella sp. GBAus27b]|nr:hypothetical protein B0O80DRAFT_100540 [Mortierella sp. GBAus27b]
MHRQPLQSLDQQQQQQQQQQHQHQQPQLQQPQLQQLQIQQDKQRQLQRSLSQIDPNLPAKPVTLSVSRFSRDCTASVLFCLRYSNQTTLAPWSSIYIPKHYRLPIPGQRQSSPGECDLVLKIFPRLAGPTVDPDTFKSQDIITACDRCRAKKKDAFQVIGPDPAVPSPQRLFFSTGREVRLFFKICCPPSHHTSSESNYGYIVTFELYHGKSILMSETIKSAGPGMIPEALEPDGMPIDPRPLKRRPSTSPTRSDSMDSGDGMEGSSPTKRSMIMSLSHLVSDEASGAQAAHPFAPATTSGDPSSPTSAVVPLSPNSYHDEGSVRSRHKSLSFDAHTPSWSYSKDLKDIRPTIERTEDGVLKAGGLPGSTKQIRKRQEPPELSELGIGQRASANLHAAYVSEQLKERTKAGLPMEGFPGVVGLSDLGPKTKNSNKPKPQHACPEPDCDKSFSRLFNLRSHMRTHSKARPFVCDACNFAFSRRHDRDRHAKKHLSEKPYKCIVCEATFVRQDALVRHLRMDGVQNACMAAMEQRTLQLHASDSNGYMLAAKQQARDEQQQMLQQENKDIEMALVGALVHNNSTDAMDMKLSNSDDQYSNEADGEDQDAHTDVSDDKEQSMALGSRPESRADDSDLKDDLGTRSIKKERLSEKQILTRPPSPHQEKNVGYDTNKAPQPYSTTSRYDKGYGPPDFYGDDRHGPMNNSARSIYPSPSRTHSRSHSQSQSYTTATADFHPHPSHHESTLSTYPPPPPFHGAQTKYHPHTYQPNYGYNNPSSMSRYHERPPHESKGYSSFDADHGGSFGARESGYDRPNDSGPQPWAAAAAAINGGADAQAEVGGAGAGGPTEGEPDKSIFEAAMGLLRIRSSQT